MATGTSKHLVGEKAVMGALEEGALAFHAKLSPGVGPEAVTPEAVREILLSNISRLGATEHDVDIVVVFNEAAQTIATSR